RSVSRMSAASRGGPGARGGGRLAIPEQRMGTVDCFYNVEMMHVSYGNPQRRLVVYLDGPPARKVHTVVNDSGVAPPCSSICRVPAARRISGTGADQAPTARESHRSRYPARLR